MATLAHRTLAYFGLKDLEDDELLDDDDDQSTAPLKLAGSWAHPVRQRPEETVGRHASFRHQEDAGASRLSVVPPLAAPVAARVHVIVPTSFEDSHQIGDLCRRADSLILNLQVADAALVRRMIDFCSGLVYALGGSMTKIGERLFLLTPAGWRVVIDDRLTNRETKSVPSEPQQSPETSAADSRELLTRPQQTEAAEWSPAYEPPEGRPTGLGGVSWERRLIWDWDAEGDQF